MSSLPDNLNTARLKQGIARYYALKSHVCHPRLLEDVVRFEGFACEWLLYQLIAGSGSLPVGPEPLDYPSLGTTVCDYIRQKKTPLALHFVTESTVESVVNMLLLLKKLDSNSSHMLVPVHQKFGVALSVFVGWKHLIHNPHLRASLIEVLTLLLEAEEREEDHTMGGYSTSDQKHPKFNDHPIVQNILVESLLEIFIDTESSGEDLHFEQKYRYRHQIYNVLSTVWQRVEYQETITMLSEEAVAHYSEAALPLFLRFLNLLVNDAVALLDRSLDVSGVQIVMVVWVCHSNSMKHSEDVSVCSIMLCGCVMWVCHSNSMKHSEDVSVCSIMLCGCVMWVCHSNAMKHIADVSVCSSVCYVDVSGGCVMWMLCAVWVRCTYCVVCHVPYGCVMCHVLR